MKRFEGKTALITGAAQGIGRGIALCLAEVSAGGCDCGGGSTELEKVPYKGQVCQAINCGEGATCDPMTGTCVSAGGGAFPGVQELGLPVPPGSVGGPITGGGPPRPTASTPLDPKIIK